MSDLPFDGHDDNLGEPRRQQLLEMLEVRRRVERGAVAAESLRHAALALSRVLLFGQHAMDE